MAIINVDLDGVEAGMSTNSLLAPGVYPCRVVKTEAKPTKSGSGECLHITFETSDGTQLMDFINYNNDNATCENIGKSQLKLLLDCLGKSPNQLARGTEIMHGVPMAIKVSIEEGDLKDNGVDRFKNNRVDKYMPAGQNTTPTNQPSGNNPPMPTEQGW